MGIVGFLPAGASYVSWEEIYCKWHGRNSIRALAVKCGYDIDWYHYYGEIYLA